MNSRRVGPAGDMGSSKDGTFPVDKPSLVVETEMELETFPLSSSGGIKLKHHRAGMLEPKDTIIVFDLHHVLMRPKYKKMAKCIISHPDKRGLLKTVSSPSLTRSFIRKIGKETPEKTMNDLAVQYEGTKHETKVSDFLSPLVTDVCNAQEPDLPTFALVHQLKDEGYGIYLLSNIGKEYFEDLQSKTDDLFSAFDGFYTTNAEDDYVNKPNIKIFEHFMAKFNPDGEFSNVLFVDDSKANVNACSSCNMIGIRYKNAVQLRKELTSKGVRIEEMYKN